MVAGKDLHTLTLKLVTLLALVTAQKTQSLALLNLDHLKKGARYSFSLPEHMKQSCATREGFCVTLEGFPPDRRLCIIKVLKEYLHRTEKLRGGERQLLISYVKPHNKVTKATISRWIKDTLSRAGVDTVKFKAHSTRGGHL